MTPPPRLARLETMTEDALAFAARIAEGNGPDSLFLMCVVELEAQRLARARERRAAFDKAIALMSEHFHTIHYIRVDALVEYRDALSALRDQEEA